MRIRGNEVYLVEKCVDDEYGCCEAIAVFESEEDAMEFVARNGLQTEDKGRKWAWRTDFCKIGRWTVR